MNEIVWAGKRATTTEKKRERNKEMNRMRETISTTEHTSTAKRNETIARLNNETPKMQPATQIQLNPIKDQNDMEPVERKKNR